MFEEGCVYHIFNRANGSENLFREDKNYEFFLKRYHKFIYPLVDTLAFCLMPNHFHFMVRIKEIPDVQGFKIQDVQGFKNLGRLDKHISRQFSNLFNSYAKAYNKVYDRHGSLFQQNMKKKKINDDSYFTQLILYIHFNPVKHGFVKNPLDWLYSSIHNYFEKGTNTYSVVSDILKNGSKEVIEWFGDINQFKAAHELYIHAELKDVNNFEIED